MYIKLIYHRIVLPNMSCTVKFCVVEGYARKLNKKLLVQLSPKNMRMRCCDLRTLGKKLHYTGFITVSKKVQHPEDSVETDLKNT